MALISCILITLHYGRCQALRFCSVIEWKRTSSHSSCYDNHSTERVRERERETATGEIGRGATTVSASSAVLFTCAVLVLTYWKPFSQTDVFALSALCERGTELVMLVDTLEKAGATAAGGEWSFGVSNKVSRCFCFCCNVIEYPLR